jgi:pimeloyl-ACP methyl ester carboxylesterase
MTSSNQQMKYYMTKICGLLSMIFLLTISVNAQTDLKAIPYGSNKATGNYITIDGAKQYYEVYGQGEPLVLIHGNGGNIEYMKPQIEYFAKKYKVIVMDCRGRGKSELGKDSLTYTQMTKDIVGILNYLHLDSTYVVGRSDGGILALLLAINYPQKVKKAVAFAANLTADTIGLYSFNYEEVKRERRQADDMISKKDTTQNWEVIQQRNRMMEFQPNITVTDLNRIKCPVLVMSTDRDIIPEEHTLFIYRNISKANLCILTGENHYVTKNNPDLFNSIVGKYLEDNYKGEELRH